MERTAYAKGTVLIPSTNVSDETTGEENGGENFSENGENTVSMDVELPVTWTEDGKAVCSVTFEFNDTVNTLHCPVETWHSGKHMLSLYYPIESIVPNVTNTFNVYLKLENGTGSVGIGDCIASISGQAMGAAATWDGKIELEETVEKFLIGGGLNAKAISDEIQMQTVEYVKRSYTDQMTGRTVFGAFCRPVTIE